MFFKGRPLVTLFSFRIWLLYNETARALGIESKSQLFGPIGKGSQLSILSLAAKFSHYEFVSLMETITNRPDLYLICGVSLPYRSVEEI